MMKFGKNDYCLDIVLENFKKGTVSFTFHLLSNCEFEI